MENVDQDFEMDGSGIIRFYDSYVDHNISVAKKIVEAETFSRNIEEVISDNISMNFIDGKELITKWDSDVFNPLVADKVFPGLLLLNKKNHKIKQIHNELWRDSINEEKYNIVITKRGMTPALTSCFVFLWNHTFLPVGNDTKILFPVSNFGNEFAVKTPDYTAFKGIAFALEQMSPNPLLELKKITPIQFNEKDDLLIESESSYSEVEKVNQLVNRVNKFAKVNTIVVNHELVKQFNDENNYSFWEVFDGTLDYEANISFVRLISLVCEIYLTRHEYDRNSTAVVVHANQLLNQIQEFENIIDDPKNHGWRENLLTIEHHEVLHKYFELVSEILYFIENTVEMNNPYLFIKAKNHAVIHSDDQPTEIHID